MNTQQNWHWHWAIPLLAMLIVCGCDYPQAGYYALVGVNHTGEQVSIHPFLVEEITDDSAMTTDFVLLLPKDGTLVEVPVANSPDVTRRSWSFAIATADTLAGSLELDLSHFNGQLKFSGEYQAAPSVQPWPILGIVASDARSSWLEFNGGLPYLHGSLDDVFSFELVQTSADEFEAALGCTVSEASRVGQTKVSLEVVESNTDIKVQAPKKQLPPATPPSRPNSNRR